MRVSALGFGCGAVGGLMVSAEPGERLRAVSAALEAGVNYFDTAPSYGDGVSERNLGSALRELGAIDEVVIGTKVMLQPEELEAPAGAVRSSLEASLRRIGRDHADVCYLHNAIAIPGGVSREATLGVVLAEFQDLVQAGLTRHVGFTAVGETAALKRLVDGTGFQVAQCYLNPLDPSGLRAGADGGEQDFGGLIAGAAAAGTGVVAIRVYAAGALSARTERHPRAWLPPRPLIPGSDYGDDVERARGLEGLVFELGLESPLELGLRFALAAPGVSTALVGLSSLEHLQAALGWAGRGPLDPQTVDRILDMAGA